MIDLQKIKVEHSHWLATGEGNPVDLHGADLSGADLSGADLHGADLHGADLH